MAINHAALKTEIDTDPRGLGLVALRNAGSDQGIADALNLVRAGTDYQISRTEVQGWELADALVRTDWTSLSASDKQLFQIYASREIINISASNIVAALVAMFGPATATRANLVMLGKRQGSRAEVLFGSQQSITATDVAVAYGRI